MDGETSAIVVQLLVNVAFLALSVYTIITAQQTLEAMTVYKESLDPVRDAKEIAVLDSEISFYWITNGFTIFCAVLFSVNILVLVLTSGILGDHKKRSSEGGKKKKSSPKRA